MQTRTPKKQIPLTSQAQTRMLTTGTESKKFARDVKTVVVVERSRVPAPSDVITTSPNVAPSISFGANEIAGVRTTGIPANTVPDGMPLEELFTRCANFGGSQGFFGRREEEVTEALNLGYALYSRICNDPGAEKSLRDRLYKCDTDRKPSLKNVAHLVMRYVCRAVTEAQRKVCSDYSTVLLWAADHSIPPLEFQQAWAATTLAECKEYIRQKRKVSKCAIDPPIEQAERHLELRVVQHRKVDVLARWPIPAEAYEAIVHDREIGTTTTTTRSVMSFEGLHALLRTIEDVLGS